MFIPQTFKHEDCLYFRDGTCMLTGARVKAEDSACPNFTPKTSVPYGFGPGAGFPPGLPAFPPPFWLYPPPWVLPWLYWLPPWAYWWSWTPYW
ncbi:hypothetical protein DRO53_01905, partial [Candidatus Bathyarchaeota archaeon]